MARSALAVRITAAANPTFIGKRFEGRPAWALDNLIRNRAKGFRTIDCSATQLPFYIWQLRQVLGDDAIQTIREDHGGDYPGKHARYVLRDLTLTTEHCKPDKKKPAAASKRVSNPKSNGRLGSASDE